VGEAFSSAREIRSPEQLLRYKANPQRFYAIVPAARIYILYCAYNTTPALIRTRRERKVELYTAPAIGEIIGTCIRRSLNATKQKLRRAGINLLYALLNHHWCVIGCTNLIKISTL